MMRRAVRPTSTRDEPDMNYRLDGEGLPEDVVEIEDETREQPVQPPFLRCRVCGLAVTSRDQRISVSGRHDHIFFNPHGLVFEIGCFAHAPGAIPVGPTSTEFSWFPGRAWQITACAACGAHLGWRFQGGDGPLFFGLILDRLREDDS